MSDEHAALLAAVERAEAEVLRFDDAHATALVVAGHVPVLAAGVRALLAQIAAWRPIIEASPEMRRGHEGCVTDPPCGACFRCDFDRAVDTLLAKEPLP